MRRATQMYADIERAPQEYFRKYCYTQVIRESMVPYEYTKGMQNKFIIIGVAVVVVVISVLVFFSGSDNVSNSQPSLANNTTVAVTAVPFTKLVQGAHSRIAMRANFLVTSSTQLNELWKMIDATSTPPAIDFKTNAVIAVFAGEQPTAGYAISVSKVGDADARRVSITLTRPGSNCMTGQVRTAPYEIAVVPVTSLSLTHEDIQIIADCSK